MIESGDAHSAASVHDPFRAAAPSTRVILVLIVLVGTALRLVALDRAPPAINQDEAVNAYDAYCLWHIGTDHHGTRWPIFFRSFGDGHAGLPVYLQIPFQMLLGMNPWSTRLPDALLGSATVLLLFLLVRLVYDDRVALWAAGLLAVSSWHIHISRLAFGIAAALCFTVFGLYLIMRYVRGSALDPPVRSGAKIALAVAGIALGATVWTYHAMLVFVPLLLLTGAIVGRRTGMDFFRRPGGRAALATLTIGLVLGVAPYLFEMVRAPDRAWRRASAEVIVHGESAIKQMARNYAVHFSPSFLFLEGDDSISQSISDYGQLHHFYILLLPLGLYRVFRRWRDDRFGRFVLYWILISPVPAALTHISDTSGHCLRTAGGIPAYDILAALGVSVLLSAALRRSRSAFRWATGAAMVLVAASGAYFGYLFFVRYPAEAAPFFFTKWAPVLKKVAQKESAYDAVLITHIGSYLVGIQYLYWSQTDPAEFRDSQPRYQVDPEVEYLLQFGKFGFASTESLDQVKSFLPPGARILVAEMAGIRVPGVPLQEFRDENGEVFVVLYEVRVGGR